MGGYWYCCQFGDTCYFTQTSHSNFIIRFELYRWAFVLSSFVEVGFGCLSFQQYREKRSERLFCPDIFLGNSFKLHIKAIVGSMCRENYWLHYWGAQLTWQISLLGTSTPLLSVGNSPLKFTSYMLRRTISNRCLRMKNNSREVWNGSSLCFSPHPSNISEFLLIIHILYTRLPWVQKKCTTVWSHEEWGHFPCPDPMGR